MYEGVRALNILQVWDTCEFILHCQDNIKGTIGNCWNNRRTTISPQIFPESMLVGSLHRTVDCGVMPLKVKLFRVELNRQTKLTHIHDLTKDRTVPTNNNSTQRSFSLNDRKLI